MKLLLSLSLILSFVISADDHETPEYKYEPEANKAEYFIGTYNQGKDLMILLLGMANLQSGQKDRMAPLIKCLRLY